jgi:hypothetical protein
MFANSHFPQPTELTRSFHATGLENASQVPSISLETKCTTTDATNIYLPDLRERGAAALTALSSSTRLHIYMADEFPGVQHKVLTAIRS